MNPAFISTTMAPNFEIKEITSGTRSPYPSQIKTSADVPGVKEQIHTMLPNISTATVHRWGTGHKRCLARRANVPPLARISNNFLSATIGFHPLPWAGGSPRVAGGDTQAAPFVVARLHTNNQPRKDKKKRARRDREAGPGLSGLIDGQKDRQTRVWMEGSQVHKKHYKS